MATQTHLSDTVILSLPAQPLAQWQSLPARQLVGIWLRKMVASFGTAFKGSSRPEERPRPVPSKLALSWDACELCAASSTTQKAIPTRAARLPRMEIWQIGSWAVS